MNLNQTGRKSLQIESKQSVITLSATNGGINIQVTEAESFVDILNELKKIGHKFVSRGQDLTRFDELVGKLSALHNDDVRKTGFEKKPANCT